MKKADKALIIEELKDKLDNSLFFYIADSSKLTVEAINKFRRSCHEKGIEVQVVKNTLVKKAMEDSAERRNFTPLYDVLAGPTTLLFSDVSSAPAKIIEEFRKKSDKPVLKAAYIDAGIYIGDDQLKALTELKSKEQLIGEIIGLLQSPAKNVISALSSGGGKLAGILKTLEERGN